jgi:hypothetical protein
MRSELVFEAMADVPNRFLLTKLVAKATRAMHVPGTRIENTTNDVLARFSRSNPLVGSQPIQDPTIQACPSKPDANITYPVERPTPAPVRRSNALLEAARVLGA